MRALYFIKYIPYEPLKVWGSLLFNGLQFSIEIFRDSHQIKNANRIKEHLINSGNPAVATFGESDLLDSIRILIFFENYIKSKLLIEGYEVYFINGDKYPELKPYQIKQKKSPVESTIVYQEKYYVKQDHLPIKNDWFYNDAITDKTLNFSTLINSGYNSVLNIPADIITFLKEINKKRNELHFLGYQKNIYSSIISTDMQKLKDYVEQIYKDLNNKLVNGTGLHKSNLIT